MAIPLQTTKIIVLVTLLITTFLFSMLPLLFTSMMKRHASTARRKQFDALMSLLSCYGAGVFLSTCLLDLFPDVQDKLDTYMDDMNLLTSYPVAEFIMSCGLFLILIIEQVVLTFNTSASNRNDVTKPLLSADNNCDDYYNPARHTAQDDSDSDGLSNYVPGGRLGQPNEYTDIRSVNRHSLGWSSEDTPDETHYTGPEDDALSQSYEDPNSHSLVRSLILLTALSLHSVFEGLAVGLQSTSAQVLQIFAALALHKSILAFSLGLNLTQSRLTIPNIIRSNLVFAITSPLGVGIGIAIMDLTAADSLNALLTNIILQGLACGTFLYIVFFEVLPHEFNSQNVIPSRLLKVLFLLLGFATIAGILFINPTTVRPLCQKEARPVP